MKTQTVKYLEIVQAGYVSGCKIRLTFNDGMVRVMDFEPFLRKALNPDITKYRQLRNFKKFHLHHGDLMWGDFDMIFPMEDLHRGNILKSEEADPGSLGIKRRGFSGQNRFREESQGHGHCFLQKSKTRAARKNT